MYFCCKWCRSNTDGYDTHYDVRVDVNDDDDVDDDVKHDDDNVYFVDSGNPYLRGDDKSHSSPLGRTLCKTIHSSILLFIFNVKQNFPYLLPLGRTL